MNYKALDIARYVINRAHHKKASISNLKLQKILYYIQAAFLIEYSRACFDDTILCWRHGPVIKNVYDNFSIFSSREIPEQKTYNKLTIENGKLCFKALPFTCDFLSTCDRTLIDKVVDGLLPYDAWYLVDRTHEEDPWNELQYYNTEIDCSSIERYFKKHPRRVYGEFN